MDLFYRDLGANKSSRIRLAVMDMWKAFRNSAAANAPQARILFDKFHVMAHLRKALDEVRKSEYGRLKGQDRADIKGQKYALLSHRDRGGARAEIRPRVRAGAGGHQRDLDPIRRGRWRRLPDGPPAERLPDGRGRRQAVEHVRLNWLAQGSASTSWPRRDAHARGQGRRKGECFEP